MDKKQSTSWQPVAPWYNKLVDQKGHYYHQHVVIPRVLKLLNLDASSRLLDVACGQGVLGRAIPKDIQYTGFDISPSLVDVAQKSDPNPKHTYRVGDATKPFPLGKWQFTHAAIVLAMQNIEHPEPVIEHICRHLISKGTLVMVLNHPAFRIPRQTGWEIDGEQKLQYRKVYRYLSPLKIPIDMHPGQGSGLPSTEQRSVTWTFHYPIGFYVSLLAKNGFLVNAMEEWASDKESTGKAAKMENRSRAEIPLFLAIRARKI